MTIQIPGQGTPVDAKMLSNIATEINRLSGQLANSSKVSTVKSPGAAGVSRSIMTSELSLFATYVDVSRTSVDVLPAADDFSVDLSGYSLTPIVVATPVHQQVGTAAPTVSIILTDITSSRVSGRVIYGSTGSINMRINILAVGIPAGVS